MSANGTNGAIAGPIWLIGCGTMAGAMLRRWLAAGLDPRRVIVIRRSGAPVADGVTVLRAPPSDGPAPALAMLGIKPQMLDAVAPALAPALAPETLLVSILAGVEIASLRQRFPTPRAVLRAMPNTPVALGRGVVALAGDGLDAAGRAAADALMRPLGLVEWIDEAAFDAVTALAGSGPAFLFRFIDALAEAGVGVGLDPARAARLALATVAGAGALAAGADESPRTLADRVASPGGSTRMGLDVLDAPDALASLLRSTIAAAVRRNRELARSAPRPDGCRSRGVASPLGAISARHRHGISVRGPFGRQSAAARASVRASPLDEPSFWRSSKRSPATSARRALPNHSRRISSFSSRHSRIDSSLIARATKRMRRLLRCMASPRN